jgi:hypothetical protein
MKFKCKASGTVVEFTSEYDIKAMLSHPSYDVVEEVKLPEPVKVVKPVKE